MKKYAIGLAILSLALGLSSGVRAEQDSLTSVLVCRARQCAVTNYSMTRGFLYNKIAQMLERNIGKSVLVCEADPVSHVCLTEGVQIPAETAFVQSNINWTGLKLIDVKMTKNGKGFDLVWDYKIQTNGTYPNCQLGLSRLTVPFVDKVEMTTQDFGCRITETGNTAINATYNIDYLDFDYGFMGAYYTIGVGEAVRGGKSGYLLMRFTAKPETTKKTVVQEKEVVSEKVSVTLEPAILQATAPVTNQEVSVALSETEDTNEIKQVDVDEPSENILIKTVVTEKTVITPETGFGDIEPPEYRTEVNMAEE